MKQIWPTCRIADYVLSESASIEYDEVFKRESMEGWNLTQCSTDKMFSKYKSRDLIQDDFGQSKKGADKEEQHAEGWESQHVWPADGPSKSVVYCIQWCTHTIRACAHSCARTRAHSQAQRPTHTGETARAPATASSASAAATMSFEAKLPHNSKHP